MNVTSAAERRAKLLSVIHSEYEPSNSRLRIADVGRFLRVTIRGSASHGGFMTVGLLGIVAMAKGTVDFFNDTGGYGFIDTDDADDDVFFHMEDVGGPDLEEGQDVEFDIEQSPKGPRATNVNRL